MIVDWFVELSAVNQALIAGLFTWGMTALGASLVFFMRRINRKLLDLMLGFAAGVMIAASVWSLLLPAIDMAEARGLPSWMPAAVGFLLGGIFLRIADQFIPHLHLGARRSEAEGVSTTWRRATLLVLAITLHNIPEGLAVGVAFGGANASLDGQPVTTLSGALALTIGIGIQNLPEGIAVAMPLRAAGVSRLKSFWYGQLSAIVEPVAAVAGAALITVAQPMLPYALAFAAGAMIYVVVEELIPESHEHGHADLATLGALAGFTVMMVLDTGLG